MVKKDGAKWGRARDLEDFLRIPENYGDRCAYYFQERSFLKMVL
jgi:hypothetical protein